MLSAFLNCLKIPELRQRILLTLGLIFVARLGSHIPVPGVDMTGVQAFYDEIADQSGGGIMSLLNMFTGRALFSGSILMLGIMPYINASIVMQIFVAVEPHLSKLAKEGDVGRQKIAQYTRYATIVIAIIQSVMLLGAMAYYPEQLHPGYSEAEYGPMVIVNHGWFIFYGTIILTAGTMLLMWIGEQITQFGIGNGVSLLITVNILASLPQAVMLLIDMLNPAIGAAAMGMDPMKFLLLVVLLVLVTGGIVALTQGQRRVPVQYAKRMIGRKVFTGQSTYLPLKVNYSGVMPVIFASAILLLPQQLFQYIGIWTGIGVFDTISNWFNRGAQDFNFAYYGIYALLIFGFSFFWVSLMFKPIEVADDLKRYGGYIPGVPPGEPTAKFLDYTMTRLTFAGAIFLTIIAVMPDALTAFLKINWQISQFFGGTGTLIIVGVLLDTMRQVETFLLQRHYDGFLRKGRAKTRNVSRAAQALDRQEIRNLRPLFIPLLILFLAGLGSWVVNRFHYDAKKAAPVAPPVAPALTPDLPLPEPPASGAPAEGAPGPVAAPAAPSAASVPAAASAPPAASAPVEPAPAGSEPAAPPAAQP